jgi:uncharacterized membrane protein
MADVATTQMVLRWIHFIAGILWIGLLFFFNLVNVPFMKALAPATKAAVFPELMSRALFWFRWSALVTVIAGIYYWMTIVGADARNARLLATSAEDASSVRSGWTIMSFFLFWTLAWLFCFMVTVKARLQSPVVVALTYSVAVLAAAYAYVTTNNHGWESNRLLCIGVGGGMGWMMIFNVWGIIWRFSKPLIRWHQELAENGTALPAEAPSYARIVFVTSRANFAMAFPMLFFMGAASHFAVFGR